MEICGEYFGRNKDEAIYEYFHTHYGAWFPELKDRTVFVRQAANLWQVKALIQRRLTVVSEQAADPVQPIDTLYHYRCACTHGANETAVSNQRLITDTVPPKTCIIMASS